MGWPGVGKAGRSGLFQGFESIDHGLDFGARLFVFRNEGGSLGDQGLLAILQGLVFFAQLLTLIEQTLEVLLESVEVFCGLFQGVHAANYRWRGK
jgi:hypothetical protein